MKKGRILFRRAASLLLVFLLLPWNGFAVTSNAQSYVSQEIQPASQTDFHPAPVVTETGINQAPDVDYLTESINTLPERLPVIEDEDISEITEPEPDDQSPVSLQLLVH